MKLSDEISNELPEAPNLQGLIHSAYIERRASLRNDSVSAAIVVHTRRDLALDGGDGWTGVDGNDMRLIQQACLTVLRRYETLGMIDEVIVRHT